MVHKLLQNKNYKLILWNLGRILVLGVILYAVFISFRMNMVGRTLWLDEMSLSWSILKRHIWELTSEPLEITQSAPIIYLYIVKAFQILFGKSEFILRLPSFLFYCGLLAVSYLFMKKSGMKLPLTGCAMIASLSVLMKYASELKQYMCEACLAMGILYLYSRYLSKENKKLKDWLLFSGICAAFIWGGIRAALYPGES